MSRFIHSIVTVYNKTHWFTDKEAWGLFRIFAFAEAAGWTMLGSAILYESSGGGWGSSAVMLAGRIHGILFIAYFVFVLLTARSMKWSAIKVAFGLAAGCLPYGSLVFEQIIAYTRRKHPVFVAPPAGYNE